MTAIMSHPDCHHKIRELFNDYMKLYASRDERLTLLFSENFSGCTAGGSILVKDRNEWVDIIRQDFSEVSGPININIRDISTQELSESVVVVTALFNIHLPVPEAILSQDVTRLVLIFRLENEAWKVVHSSTSLPCHMMQGDEVLPINNIQERNQLLEALVEERTRALNEKEEFYRILTEDTLDVIWRVDDQLRITYISPSDERFRGFKAEEVVGKHVFELFNEEGIAIVAEAFRKRQEAEQQQNQLGFVKFEAPHRCKDGRVIWGEVCSKAVRDTQGKIIGFHGITRENTKRKQIHDQVRQLAFYDTLTHLPNRRLLIERLSNMLAANSHTCCYGALMFVDLDNFKPLNDNYGHFVGDLLLVEVASRLKSCVRETDSVARFGGDEFVVMLGELVADYPSSLAHTKIVAEKIRARLADVYQLNVAQETKVKNIVEHHCSASIGVFVFPTQGVNTDDILRYADKAMYQAKAAGRNTIRFFETNTQA